MRMHEMRDTERQVFERTVFLRFDDDDDNEDVNVEFILDGGGVPCGPRLERLPNDRALAIELKSYQIGSLLLLVSFASQTFS